MILTIHVYGNRKFLKMSFYSILHLANVLSEKRCFIRICKVSYMYLYTFIYTLYTWIYLCTIRYKLQKKRVKEVKRSQSLGHLWGEVNDLYLFEQIWKLCIKLKRSDFILRENVLVSTMFGIAIGCPGENPITEYKKRLLLRCIHHFKSDVINNMDHLRILGTEPVILVIPKSARTSWNQKGWGNKPSIL